MVKPKTQPALYSENESSFPLRTIEANPLMPSVPRYPQEYYPPASSVGNYPYPNSGYSQPSGVHTLQYPYPPQMQPYLAGSYVPSEFVPSPQHPGGPIVHQPEAGGVGQAHAANYWMNIPQGQTNCPPGLEYLSMIDQLLVEQKVDLQEALVEFETADSCSTMKKFTVRNSIGQKVYLAAESSDCCSMFCCGMHESIDLKFLDGYRNQVIHMRRPLACKICCFPYCLPSMEVSSPPGTIIGTIAEEWSIGSPSFVIKNALGDSMFRIKGNCCQYGPLCGDFEFKVFDMNSKYVGKILKQWPRTPAELLTEHIGITFSMDLDVRMKAVLLGALFFISNTYGGYAASDNFNRQRKTIACTLIYSFGCLLFLILYIIYISIWK